MYHQLWFVSYFEYIFQQKLEIYHFKRKQLKIFKDNMKFRKEYEALST